MSTLFHPIKRPFKSKNDSFTLLQKFLECLQELAKKLIELGYVHEDNLVVVHPGIQEGVLDVSLLDDDIISLGST